jgi:hypothetical protein
MPFIFNLPKPSLMFTDPLRPSKSPEMKKTFEIGTSERREFVDHKTHSFGYHVETKNMISNAGDKDQRRITTKARMEGETNIIFREIKFGTPERHHKGETRDTKLRMNRSGEGRSDLSSKFHTPRLV